MPPPDAQFLAAVDPATELEVTVLVRPRRSLDELEARLASGGQPALSREDFAAQYGAAPEDLANVADFGRAHGLHVVDSSPARRTVVLRGTAAQLAEAFGVTLARYRDAAAREFRAPSGEVQWPTDIAPVVQGVFGLDDRPVAQLRGL